MSLKSIFEVAKVDVSHGIDPRVFRPIRPIIAEDKGRNSFWAKIDSEELGLLPSITISIPPFHANTHQMASEGWVCHVSHNQWAHCKSRPKVKFTRPNEQNHGIRICLPKCKLVSSVDEVFKMLQHWDNMPNPELKWDTRDYFGIISDYLTSLGQSKRQKLLANLEDIADTNELVKSLRKTIENQAYQLENKTKYWKLVEKENQDLTNDIFQRAHRNSEPLDELGRLQLVNKQIMERIGDYRLEEKVENPLDSANVVKLDKFLKEIDCEERPTWQKRAI